jgi:hypothetical protein|eukprot:4875899-Prymnesium_polylepis.1
MSRKLTVRGVPFARKNIDGDYKWMVKQPKYYDALFVIMENFADMVGDDRSAGGGTACLRPVTLFHSKQHMKPRAAGIPTGWSSECGGFRRLAAKHEKKAIDLALEKLVLILDTWPSINLVIFSCDDNDHKKIGTGIFKDSLHPIVVDYISTQLQLLPSRAQSKWTFDKIRMHELWLGPTMADHKRIAFLEDRVATLEKKPKKASTGGSAGASKAVVLATKPITSFMDKRGRSEGEAETAKKQRK